MRWACLPSIFLDSGWVDHAAPSAWNLLPQEQEKCSFQLMPLALTASAAVSVSN